jgi:hypothetical protein
LVDDLAREELTRAAAKMEGRSNKVKGRVLYACENLSTHFSQKYGDSRFLGYDEFEALDFFFLNLLDIAPKASSVMLRRHPSEARGKYAEYESRYPFVALSGPEVPLIEDLFAAEVVVGCQSQVLVAAVNLGLTTISCIPPWGKECCLPFQEIERYGKP